MTGRGHRRAITAGARYPSYMKVVSFDLPQVPCTRAGMGFLRIAARRAAPRGVRVLYALKEALTDVFAF